MDLATEQVHRFQQMISNPGLRAHPRHFRVSESPESKLSDRTDRKGGENINSGDVTKYHVRTVRIF
jgi:hypothetical protein